LPYIQPYNELPKYAYLYRLFFGKAKVMEIV